jgi:hypothetical protein
MLVTSVGLFVEGRLVAQRTARLQSINAKPAAECLWTLPTFAHCYVAGPLTGECKLGCSLLAISDPALSSLPE